MEILNEKIQTVANNVLRSLFTKWKTTIGKNFGFYYFSNNYNSCLTREDRDFYQERRGNKIH